MLTPRRALTDPCCARRDRRTRVGAAARRRARGPSRSPSGRATSMTAAVRESRRGHRAGVHDRPIYGAASRQYRCALPSDQSGAHLGRGGMERGRDVQSSSHKRPDRAAGGPSAIPAAFPSPTREIVRYGRRAPDPHRPDELVDAPRGTHRDHITGAGHLLDVTEHPVRHRRFGDRAESRGNHDGDERPARRSHRTTANVARRHSRDIRARGVDPTTRRSTSDRGGPARGSRSTQPAPRERARNTPTHVRVVDRHARGGTPPPRPPRPRAGAVRAGTSPGGQGVDHPGERRGGYPVRMPASGLLEEGRPPQDSPSRQRRPRGRFATATPPDHFAVPPPPADRHRGGTSRRA